VFYRDEEWRGGRTEGRGVRWIDTSPQKSTPQQEPDGTSWYNPAEVETVARLLNVEIEPDEEVLVVSPYTAQRNLLEGRLPHRKADTRISTVDGCQGASADTVIFSPVRLRVTGGDSFVGDARRLNVALSRARTSLFIVGNLLDLEEQVGTLSTGEMRHLTALVELFRPGGTFAHRVILSDEIGGHPNGAIPHW
jgi:superfamily I DNA and/or RNA helicase